MKGFLLCVAPAPQRSREKIDQNHFSPAMFQRLALWKIDLRCGKSAKSQFISHDQLATASLVEKIPNA